MRNRTHWSIQTRETPDGRSISSVEIGPIKMIDGECCPIRIKFFFDY